MARCCIYKIRVLRYHLLIAFSEVFRGVQNELHYIVRITVGLGYIHLVLGADHVLHRYRVAVHKIVHSAGREDLRYGRIAEKPVLACSRIGISSSLLGILSGYEHDSLAVEVDCVSLCAVFIILDSFCAGRKGNCRVIGIVGILCDCYISVASRSRHCRIPLVRAFYASVRIYIEIAFAVCAFKSL